MSKALCVLKFPSDQTISLRIIINEKHGYAAVKYIAGIQL